MHNHGTIIATDSDKRRLAPIFERLKRAGVTIADVRAPKGRDDEPLKGLEQQADLVLVDAPCSGTGTWRRHPDAKWRMRPVSLDDRIKDQALVLDRAARYVKPGGRIAYITCSLLPAENDGAIESFLERSYDFYVVPAEQVAEQAGLPDLARFRSARGTGLLLSPKRCETDGFFIAILQHRS
jgi:16S rRNA (cytosine967-C5)-methyltransferase